MPVPMLKKLAIKSGKSISTLEKYWEEAKVAAEKKFNKKDTRYWAYVSSIVKKRSGVSESFKDFLTNKKQIILEVSDESLQKIKQDCSQFINQSGGYPAFRGMESVPSFYTQTKNNYYPRDSSGLLTNSFNFFIEQKFHLKRIRTSKRIYVSGDLPTLHQYGRMYYIFPKNGFDFVWSNEVSDATEVIQGKLRDKIKLALEKKFENEKASNIYDEYYFFTKTDDKLESSDFEKEDFFEPMIEILNEIFEEYEYQNTNLKQALKSGNEIIIQTDGYYSIKVPGEPDEDEYADSEEPPYDFWSKSHDYYTENIFERLK